MASKANDTNSEPPYDLIVVGSGMAGLYVALESLRRNRHQRILVLEKYKSLGGRASTFRSTAAEAGGEPLQWEAGAGRISSRHTLLMNLLRRYRLTFVPISERVLYSEAGTASAPAAEESPFEAGLPIFFDTIARLPAEDLAKHTIRQLLEKIHGPKLATQYLVHYPYRAELETMRADLALESFRTDLGTQGGFGICKEGLSTLVDKMVQEIERRGGSVRSHHEFIGIETGAAQGHRHRPNSPLKIQVRVGPPKEGTARPLLELTTAHLVLAVESAALTGETTAPAGLPRWPGLKHLSMTPLLRIYATFPEETPWAPARIVTAAPPRYIIPAGGRTVQISYTDSQDALYWKRIIDEKGEQTAGLEVVKDLRRLLRADIPSPTLVKTHFWRNGVTNWLPGSYDPRTLSRAALRPFPDTLPNLHFCGESFSLRQGWIEGALEHAAELVATYSLKSRNTSKKSVLSKDD